MKFLFVGDPHFSSENLPIRKDNYPETLLNKTQQVLDIGKKRGIDLLILGGDFIHNKSKMSVGYLNKLMALFNSYSFPKACVIGNHDLFHHKIETVEKTMLGTMFCSGVFLPKIGEFKVETEDSIILFLPYMDEIFDFSVNNPDNKKLILIAHSFFGNQQFKSNLPLGLTDIFHYICCGHDHDAYPIQKVNRATIIRPGALSRGTRHQSNLNRPIQVAYVDTQKDLVEYIELTHRPANEVFSMERMEREVRVRDAQIVEEFSKVVTTDEVTNIITLVDGLTKEEKVKNNTLDWLKVGGII